MTTEPVFVPSNPIEERIHAGDLDGLIAVLRDMSQPQRKTHIGAVRSIGQRINIARWQATNALIRWWGAHPTDEQLVALGGAMFFCGTAQDRTALWTWNDRLYPFLDLLEPATLLGLAEEMSGEGAWRASLAQRLVLNGLSDRPDSDAYIRGLINAPRWTSYAKSTVLDMIALDPGLLDGPIMRLFEVEGTGDVNMASVEKYSYGKNTWSQALLELARSGKLSRTQLIAKSLSTLEMDWPQFRAGWFSRFHDLLAPTVDEMAPLAARYLGLCHSRIAPTVTMALASLAALLKAGRLDPAVLMDALAPAMSSAVKGQVDSALKLLDVVVKKDPGLAHAASALAQRALAHESAELHKKILARLAVWGFDEATRNDLAAMVPYISAVHRDALSALAGVADAPKAEPESAAIDAVGLLSPLDPSRRLAPINDIDELVQTIAFVFENDTEIDQFERAVDALARLLPAPDDQRLTPVLKRAKKIMESERTIARALALVLACAIARVAAGEGDGGLSAGAELSRRVADMTAFMAQRTGLSPLSCATHMRGFIDPLVLIERIEAHAGATWPLHEQVRALLRLAPENQAQALVRARALKQTAFVQALRYALGDDEVDIGTERALFVAAARIRHPGADDERLLAAYGDMGPDGPRAAQYSWILTRHNYDGGFFHALAVSVFPAPVRSDPAFITMRRHEGDRYDQKFCSGLEADLLYTASIVPASLEAFFAYGALQIGFNIDWWEARWQDKAYLALLLDRTTPATMPALRMLAYALGGKEPGQTAMAIDAFVAILLEGRADVLQVAQFIRADLLSAHGKCARYANNLAGVARAHPSMPALVCEAIGIILQFGGADAPKDTVKLLELLLELSLANGLVLPAQTVQAITLLKLTGKGKLAQKDLLARCG